MNRQHYRISFLTKILRTPKTSPIFQILSLTQYSLSYDVLRSFSGMQRQTALNILFQSKYSRRQSISNHRNVVQQGQVMDIFSPTNKQKVIKCIQRLLQYPALVRSCRRQAGVLIPLCVVNGNPSVLFTVRSPNLFTNRGDVSFPGGMKDQHDEDLIQTAVRETEEELGLPKKHIEVWAPLPQMPDRLGKTAITPVVGFIHNYDISSLKVNPSEVSSVFTLSLEHLINPSNQRYTRFKSGIVYPVFVNGPAPVWGLTAIILDRTLAVLFPDFHKVKFQFPKWKKKHIKEGMEKK